MSDVASFTFTRSKRDYFDAIMLNALRSPSFWWALAIAPVFNALIMAYYSAGGPLGTRAFAITLIFVATAAVVGAVMVFCYYLAARKAWRSPAALAPISFEFDGVGLRASSEVGSGQALWAVFGAVFESKSLIVLRQLPGILLILPKRNADESALVRLRSLLRAHISRAKLLENRA